MYRACETCCRSLDLTAARTGPHDRGAGRLVDAPGGPEVAEHAPEKNDKISFLCRGVASKR